MENICGGPVRRAVSAPGRAHLRVESERSRSSFSTGTNTSSFEVLNNAYDVAAGEHSNPRSLPFQATHPREVSVAQIVFLA